MTDQYSLPFSEVTNDYPTSYLDPVPGTAFITRVTIQNFKRVEHSTVDLGRLSILTGVNNSGKSTILQAIWLAFECLRLCVDRDTWQVSEAGRALAGFDFLPANEPQDLWFGRRYRSGNTPLPVRIRIELSTGFYFTAQINLYFGAINVRIVELNTSQGTEAIKAALLLAPMLIPGHVEITTHEESKVPALIHKFAQSGQLSSILRNVLLSLSKDTGQDVGASGRAFGFVANAIERHFGLKLKPVVFDPVRDLEIRAPYVENACELDIVAAGSGFHQILKLAAFIVWRNAKVVLLDEPDAHLHTSLLTRLSEFLRDLSHGDDAIQIVLATHSKDLISRAPLDAVIPVDASARQMKPISTIEHLLAEFRKLGPVGNFDLALLYQTKRCLFVEGPSDVSWLPLIAARLKCPVFNGPKQFVIFDFKGVEKFTMVKDLAGLFDRLVGASLTWYVLRDREASIPRVLDHLVSEARRKNIQHFHIWERYGIENYLLEPAIVAKAIRSEAVIRNEPAPTDADIWSALDKACHTVLAEARTDFVAASQTYYIKHELVTANPREAAIADALAYIDACSDRDSMLRVLPGYKVFGQFAQKMQETHGLTLRFESLIEATDESNAPAELKAFFQELTALQDTGSGPTA